MAVFDDIINAVPEEDRGALRKHPQLKAAVEQLEASVAEANSKIAEWDDFIYGRVVDPATKRREGGEYDPEAKTFRRVTEIQGRLAEAEARTAQLVAAAETGAEMTFDEILQGLQAKGFMTKTEVEATVLPLVAKFAPAETVSTLAANFQHIYARTANLPVKHRAEFGEDLDFDAYFQHMQKTNGLGDPQRAYEGFVAGRREEIRKAADTKREADHQTELATARETARTEGIAQGKKDAVMGQGGSLPVDQAGPPNALMPGVRAQLEKAKQADGSFKIPADSKLGDGVRAAIAAQLHKEGKLQEQVQ